MKTAIHARSLTLAHRPEQWTSGHPHALDRIDLDIPEGAVVGLVGRNGAGKSTLIRALLGLVTPTEGDSTLLGAPSLDLPDSVRERLGYVAQTPDLFRGMTGLQHLQEMAAVYAGVDLKLAAELAVRLEVALGKRADELSLGDQQKLSLVLALCHDPDLLLLDEPMASLDPISRRDVLRVLFGLRRSSRPRTVLISSHLLSDLERIVSHVVFLRHGGVQLFMAWDELLEHLRRLPCDRAPSRLEPGQLHWSSHGGGQLLVDTRLWPATSGVALDMTDVMEVLNS